MRSVPSTQQASVSDASADRSLSVMERAKIALAKANASKNPKRTISHVRAGQSTNENKAPRTQRCPPASHPLDQTSNGCNVSLDKRDASTQKRTVSQPKAKEAKQRKPLTEFEKTFGISEGAPEQKNEKDQQRLQAMAGDMEWSLFSTECKRLAEQERIEERMANQMNLKVSAFHCNTCNSTSESRRPQCAGHDVKKVQAIKRWFKCGSCGNRTTSVARRFPAWRCDRCRMQDWQPCSMYIIGKDKVAEVENEVYGYADSSLLKVSGPDFDTRL